MPCSLTSRNIHRFFLSISTKIRTIYLNIYRRRSSIPLNRRRYIMKCRSKGMTSMPLIGRPPKNWRFLYVRLYLLCRSSLVGSIRKRPDTVGQPLFKVLRVLFLGTVSSAFLPSKKACWAPKFRHLGVDQQYPLSAHETRGAMLPAPRAQKLSLQINVALVDSQEVCGRYADESPRSHTLATPLRVTENSGNLGKLRQPPLLKARHTHGNTLPGWADFTPLLAI